MKAYDVIIIGAGIVGLSLAIELRKQGIDVLIVDKSEPGREASWAAGGMLADCGFEIPPLLLPLANASARLYPEFVHELEDESGQKIDLRPEGTLLFHPPVAGDSYATQAHSGSREVSSAELLKLEPHFSATSPAIRQPVLFLEERSVDPRHVVTAAILAARHRGVHFSSGDRVLSVEVSDGKASGVRTNKTQFTSALVVNCAGAWAGEIGPHAFPTRPVKGQMLCVVMPQKEMVQHVVRIPNMYLIPRSDGRLLIGATQEEAGFDKQTIPETLQKLRQSAIDLVPALAEARILEAWAGLRPGTPDNLPILGPTSLPGYFVATGHFRDGILLAPITAKLMAEWMVDGKPSIDLSAFRNNRFQL